MRGCQSHPGPLLFSSSSYPQCPSLRGLRAAAHFESPVNCTREKGQALVIPPSSLALSFGESHIYKGLLGGIR